VAPLPLGLLAGFWVADRGVALVPTALAGASAVLLVAGLAWLAAASLRRGAGGGDAQQAVARRSLGIGAAVTAFALAGLGATRWVARPSPLVSLGDEAFDAAFAQDGRAYLEIARGMEALVARLERAGVPAAEADRVLGAEEERLVLAGWLALRDHALALDGIRRFYEDYYRVDPARGGRARHVKSFLLTYAAELALYENVARFSARVGKNDSAKKFLDAPHPAANLPAGSLSRLREELLGARDQARVLAGERYLGVLAEGFGARRLAERLGIDWLWRRVEAHLGSIRAAGTLARAETSVRADLQGLKRGLRDIWYPVQKEAAEILGDTRVRRIGWYLIDRALQEEVDARLEPGDVLLARKNWYLSNVGLPGFWPHAIVYLGEPDKLRRFFDDPDVRAWVAAETGEPLDLATMLERRHGRAWQSYVGGTAGDAYRVIEAVSEGVVFSTLDHCAGDYLAALRPRLDKRAKAQAVAAAFAHFDKPYDFDFDFATDHALVCTELVWRAYRPAQGKRGFDIPLVELAGRWTLPANEIAAHYARQHGRDGADLDFVLFVDAREKLRKAFLSTEAAFRASAERSKWDLSQE
jgi:hypothetical protein